MSKSNLLWMIPDKPDNISTGRQRIATGLRDRGHTVTLTDSWRNALKTLLTNPPDVVMSTTAGGGFIGPVANARSVPLVVDYVDPILQMYYSSSPTTARIAVGLQHISHRCADGILYVYHGESLRINRYEKPIRKTTLGVDYDRFAYPSGESIKQAEQLLETLECDVSEYSVYIGGLGEIYNIKNLLESAEQHGFELVIAGTGTRREMVSKTARNNKNIHYLGVVDHAAIPGLLNNASCGLCLVDDPHTVKVLEYAASGLPIVHLKGRAEPVLPTQGVEFTTADPKQIAAAVDTVKGIETTSELEAYAHQHDYGRVIDDYGNMIETVQ